MKVLVVGGGGREHAIIRKLGEKLPARNLFCAPGNAGIAHDAICVRVNATNVQEMVQYALSEKIDFCVVTPDDPLVLGMADAMEEAGIPAFGPSKAAAQIEGSKVFAKNLMKKYHIPTADYAVFQDPQAALDYIRQRDRFPVVVKADGLALGKGVLICQDLSAAQEALHDILVAGVFGQSGKQVVVEEFLTGPELSLLTFCDGKTIVPMVSSMDHKRALDGNEGLNTGGMGTVAPNLHYTEDVAALCMDAILLPTVRAMEAEGVPFKGCLYFGLMLTPNGPKVIEYNCRFGDPETQVVLPLLQSDLLTIMQAVRNGCLTPDMVTFSSRACACVILASGGYPQHYETGLPIQGLDANGQLPGLATIYHAGTSRQRNGQLVTAGGRVMGVTATGDTMAQAIQNAYAAADHISFPGMHMRRDIGRLNLP